MRQDPTRSLEKSAQPAKPAVPAAEPPRPQQLQTAEADPFPHQFPKTPRTDVTSVGSYARFLSRASPSRDEQAARDVISLQRAFGNRYVQRALGLAAAKPDPETDPAIAGAVARDAARSAIATAPPPEPERHEALDSQKANQFGKKLGADFSGIKLHSGDGVAEEHGAAAVTFGKDIHFAHGKRASGGDSLLAHELVHTVQQGSVPVRGATPKESTGPAQAEAEARQVGPAATQGKPGTVRSVVNAQQPKRKEKVGAESPKKPAGNAVRGSKAATPPGTAVPTAMTTSLESSVSLPARRLSPTPLRGGMVQPTKGLATPTKTAGHEASVPRGIVEARTGVAAIPPRAKPQQKRSSRGRSSPATETIAAPPIPANAPSAALGHALFAEGSHLAAGVRKSAEASATAVRTHVENQGTQLRNEHVTKAAAIRAEAASHQRELAAQQQSATASIQSSQQAAQASVTALGEAGTQAVHQSGERTRQRAAQTSAQAGGEFEAGAAAESNSFQKASNDRSSQAQGGATATDGDSADAQQEASSKIGHQATTNFAKDASNVAAETQTVVASVHERLAQGLIDFSGMIEHGAAQLASGVSGLVDAAHAGFAETVTKAASSIAAFSSQTISQISEGAAAAERDLEAGVEATVANLETTGERHAAGIESHGKEIAAAVVRQASAAALKVSAIAGPEARKTFDDSKAHLGSAVSHAGSQIGKLGTQVTTGIARHTKLATQEMGHAAAESAEQMRNAASHASKKLAEAGGHIGQHLVSGAQSVGQQIQKGASQSTAELEHQAGQFETHTQKAAQESRQNLAAKVAEAGNRQQSNLGTFQNHKSSATSEIKSKYGSLKSEAESRSQSEKRDNASQSQTFLEWILPASWTKAIKDWFASFFGKWFGGFLYGILNALIGILIVVGIAALAFLIAGPLGVAFVIGFAIGAGLVLGVYSRFKMFEAYNGRGPGFWEGAGLVLLGILDITGIPQIIEGLAGRQAFSNGHKLDYFDAGENVGSGLVQLIAILFLLRGAKGIKPRDVKPDVEPEVDPKDVKPDESPAAILRAKLLKHPKIADAAQLDRLLGNAKLADALQLERLLDNPKLANGSQLERLLGDAKLADAAQLERLLGNAKIADAAQLERLLGRVADATQLERLLAHVTDGTQLETLLNLVGNDAGRLENMLNRIGDANDLERFLRAGYSIWEGQFGPAKAEAVRAADYATANGGAAQPGYAGNRPYGNNGGHPGDMILPRKDAGGNPIAYTEYDIHPRRPGVNRGPERIVIGGDGRRYYTGSHYRSFTQF